MSLSKNFVLPSDRGTLEFRAEIFNLVNRVNFGMANAGAFVGTQTNPSIYDVATGVTASNPLGTAGQITTTATTSRQVQLSLRWSF